MDEMEAIGVKEFEKAGFVLIAGGMGERLGYSGIKIGLPVCTIEEDYSYMKYYCNYILACQERALNLMREERPEDDHSTFRVPLCIMVSDQTHQATINLLKDNRFFGLDDSQVEFVRQENVPALADKDGNLVIDHQRKRILTKPHGHGDIHTLMYQSKVAKRWLENGKEWVIFLFDTNALAVRTLPATLGVSKTNNWEMNTVCTPRMPG